MRISKVVHQLLLAATVKASHDEDVDPAQNTTTVEYDRNNSDTWGQGGQSRGIRYTLVDGYNITLNADGQVDFQAEGISIIFGQDPSLDFWTWSIFVVDDEGIQMFQECAMDKVRDESGELLGFQMGTTYRSQAECPYADVWEITESEWSSGDKSYVIGPDGQYIYLYDNDGLFLADAYGQEYIDYDNLYDNFYDENGELTDEYYVYLCELYGDEEDIPFCDEDGNYDPDLLSDDYYIEVCELYGEEEELPFCDGTNYNGMYGQEGEGEEEADEDSEWYQDTDFDQWDNEAEDLMEEGNAWKNFGDDAFAVKTGAALSALVVASLF